jgi:hypothetical protein
MIGGAAGVLYLYKVIDSGSDLVGADFVNVGTNPIFLLDGDLVAGNTLTLEAIGSTLNIYRNSTLVATRIDSTYTGGQPGVHSIGNAQGLIAAFGTEGMSAGGGPVTLGEMAIGTTFTIT